MKPTYTGTESLQQEGSQHSADVKISVSISSPPSKVSFTPQAIQDLETLSMPDYEFNYHNVYAALLAQINTINVAGQLPIAGSNSFHAVVLSIRTTDNSDREVRGFLLSVAAMDAVSQFLCDWETEHTV